MPARLGREHPASISQCLPCLFRQYFFQNTIYLFIQLLDRTIIVDDIFRIDAERWNAYFRLEQMVLLELIECLGRIIGILAARRETIITPLHIRLDIDEREFRKLPDQIDVRQPADAVDHDQPVLILLDIILYDVGEDTFAEPLAQVMRDVREMLPGLRQMQTIEDIAKRIGKAELFRAVFFHQVFRHRVFARSHLPRDPQDYFLHHHYPSADYFSSTTNEN